MGLSKQDKLAKLDMAVLDRMIELVESEQTELLPELTAVIGYLSKNNLVADKQSSTIEDEIKQRVKEANDRRESKEG